MADFEELRLTVNLVDSATPGLQRIRNELGLLTQTASQMANAVVTASQSVVTLGNAVGTAAPKVQTMSAEMRALQRHAMDTGRALGQMGSSMQQGVAGLPQIALGLWDASAGVRGLGNSLKAVSPAASSAVMAFGGVALGVVAVGAAVVAYGISVFRFAKEMEQLGKTARTLGMSFGELKNAQDQAKAFGHTAEGVVRSFQGIQAAQFDLWKNNSQLRQKLVSQGVDANWVNAIAGANPMRARAMIAEYGVQLEKQALASGAGKGVAAALRNQFYADLGQNPEDMQLALKPVDPAREAELKRIEELSRNVGEVWGEISLKLQKLTFGALSVGLPVLLGTLRYADELFSAIGGGVLFVDKQLQKLGTNLVDVLKWVPVLGPVIQMIEYLYRAGGGGASEKPESEEAPATPPETPRSPLPTPPGLDLPGFPAPGVAPPVGPGINLPGFPAQPAGYSGANDNNPLLNRVAFTNEELVDETGDNTEKVGRLTGQLERLNDFFDKIESQKGTGGGGGFTNAAYTPESSGSSPGGGGTSPGGGSSTPGFGSSQFPNLGTSYGNDPAPSAPASSGAGGSRPSSGGGGAGVHDHNHGGTTAAPSGGGGGPSASNIFNGTAGATVPESTIGGGGGRAPAEGSVSSVIQSSRVSSPMGMRTHPVHGGQRMHAGTDTPAPAGTPFKSRYKGRVSSINGHGDITVENENGTTSVYRHVDPRVKVGQTVTPETTLGGLRARDPRSTGPHLHEELRDSKGKLVDTAKLDADARQRVASSGSVKVGGYPSAWLTGDNGAAQPGRAGLGASLAANEPDRAALDRSALADAMNVNATGKVTVDVADSRGGRGNAAKTDLFADGGLQRASAGQLTQYGASAADTAKQYMASR